jgi:outer membrane protein assembly factor BamB
MAVTTATTTSLAADPLIVPPAPVVAPVWPTQILTMRYNNNHDSTWGTAVSSDINWAFDTKDAPFTDVNVADGIAYVGAMNNSIYAMNAATGQFLWKFTANNWIMTDPIVADGKLFAGSGNRLFQNPNLRGTGSNSLYALNAKTGQKLWEYPVPGEAMPTPVYNNGKVYFLTGARTLYALDANTGALDFKMQVDSYFSMGSPALDGNLLFAGGANPFVYYAFDIANHSIVWQHSFADVKWGLDDCSPTVADGTIIGEGVNEDYSVENALPYQTMYALDEKTGALKWTFDMGEGPYIDDNKAGTPVVKDGVVYAGSPISRRFYAIDEATGKLLWNYNAGVPIRGTAAILGDYLLVIDIQANIHVLNIHNGRFIDKISLGGSVRPGGVNIFNGTAYVADQAGKIYAFSLFPLISGFYLKSNTPDNQPTTGSNQQYFPPTGHTVSDQFLSYWQTNGGLTQFGYPVSDPFLQFQAKTGKTLLVQYFERARFELHPEHAGTPYEVELGLLGTDLVAKRSQQAPFKPIAIDASSNSATSLGFSATGHTISGDFLTYWQANGGLARYGYPLSQPFSEVNPNDGKTYTVQYFERARFELHPEHAGTPYLVELGQLGQQVMATQNDKGLIALLKTL